MGKKLPFCLPAKWISHYTACGWYYLNSAAGVHYHNIYPSPNMDCFSFRTTDFPCQTMRIQNINRYCASSKNKPHRRINFLNNEISPLEKSFRFIEHVTHLKLMTSYELRQSIDGQKFENAFHAVFGMPETTASARCTLKSGVEEHGMP